MFRVFGRVLLLENGAPLPNVIVAAYDSDRPISGPPFDLARAERLGSSPTDQRGEFSIDFTEREFAAPGGERRADIVVAVFAPEIAGRAAPTDPLYVSTATRRESGAVEGYVIFLPGHLLLEGGLPLPGSAPRETVEVAAAGESASVLADRIKRRALSNAAVRTVLAPVVRRSRQQRRGARALLANVLRTRQSEGAAADRYVSPGVPAAPVFAAARAKGIQRLADLSSGLRGVTLYGTPQQMKTLGVAVTDGAVVPPDDGISSAALEVAAPNLFVPPAVRVGSLLEQCKAAEKAHAAEPPPLSAVDEPDVPDPTLVPFEQAMLRQLHEAILNLDGQNGSNSNRPNADTIAAALDAQIASGPADAPSYHDFHTLRIAWFDVWSSVIDGVAYAALLDLYHSIVEVVPPEELAADASEVDDLEALLQRMDDVVWAVSSATAPAPAAWGELLKEKLLAIVDTMPQSSEIGASMSFAAARKTIEDEITNAINELGQEGTTISATPVGLSGRLRQAITGIKNRLAEGYKFEIFAPDSHNFGIVTTYRQRWQPIAYQAGDLVATIPLAPGEKRTYRSTQTIKTTRAQKEVEKALSARHGESTETSRSEAEIVRKAKYSTNFKMAAEGGFHVAVANVQGSIEFGANQELESVETKRFFREAVRKATQEYRNERSVEVSAENVVTTEAVETGEISNPNNELTVTYLFYELQRRVEISEQLHRVTPVVLFAFDVPKPNAIDEAWLLTHDWILRRVLLDDNLQPALEMLANNFAGDELAVDIRRREWETQLEVVRALQWNESLHVELRVQAREALRSALAKTGNGSGGVLGSVTGALFGDDSGEKAEARRNAAQQALNWMEADLARAEEKLGSAISALQSATEAYTIAVRDQLNRRTAIDRLRMHVKENILYYMQAIWLHEPPDQRYFRVYNKPIEWPAYGGVNWVVEALPPASAAPSPGDSGGGDLGLGDLAGKLHNKFKDAIVKVLGNSTGSPPVTLLPLQVKIEKPVLDGGTRLLHEVADVDNLLGFKGNYAIFPLTEHNAITLYMSQSFLDAEFGIKDPDPWGEIPPASEAVAIARCAWNHPGSTDDLRKEITKWLLFVLANQRQVSEEIIIPTGQLFIEALTGTHTLLEDFKLRHRVIDVEKARAEMVQARLEALRYAARVSAGKLGDPEVQTQIVSPMEADLAIPVLPTPPNP